MNTSVLFSLDPKVKLVTSNKLAVLALKLEKDKF